MVVSGGGINCFAVSGSGLDIVRKCQTKRGNERGVESVIASIFYDIWVTSALMMIHETSNDQSEHHCHETCFAFAKMMR
jgi:hypothetical protein